MSRFGGEMWRVMVRSDGEERGVPICSALTARNAVEGDGVICSDGEKRRAVERTDGEN